jgi:hypothetical protein
VRSCRPASEVNTATYEHEKDTQQDALHRHAAELEQLLTHDKARQVLLLSSQQALE